MKAFKKPDIVANILKKTLKKNDLSEKIANYEVFLQWEQIVGPQIAQHTKPKSVAKDKLIIEVAHASWKVELNFLKEKILKQIQQQFPHAKLKELQFILKT